MHYIGVVFYGLFASGELQPWSESKSLDDKPWNPYDAAFQGEINKSASVRDLKSLAFIRFNSKTVSG